MSNAIEVENVSLHFPRSRGIIKSILNIFRSKDTGGKGSYTALDNINLTIGQGEVIGVIGRNGSGKSTLLRVMAGIYQPDEGTIRSLPRISLLAGVSVGLNGNLTGRENVHLMEALSAIQNRKWILKWMIFYNSVSWGNSLNSLCEPIRLV